MAVFIPNPHPPLPLFTDEETKAMWLMKGELGFRGEGWGCLGPYGTQLRPSRGPQGEVSPQVCAIGRGWELDCLCCRPQGRGGPRTQPVSISSTWAMPSTARWFECRGRLSHSRGQQTDGCGAGVGGGLHRARRRASPLRKEAPKAKSMPGDSHNAR